MSFRPPELIFADILEAGSRAQSYIQDITLEDFISKTMIFDAVVRNLAIIGEAAARLDEDTRKKFSSIPWRKIVGFRNIAVHDYFGVDPETVWDILKNEMPSLMIALGKYHP